MKLPTRKQAEGAAVVIVLCLLVMVLGLALIFLNRVTIERSASSSDVAASATRSLADIAVNVVQGQIRDATTAGPDVAWTSQPGMIRTFAAGSPGSLTASSNLFRVYKLYSAQEMISTSYEAGADAPTNNWASAPAMYTDLNAPVVSGGEPSYPILDPRALGHVEGFSVTNAPTGGSSNALPMPIKWLYVLEDGRLVAPTVGSTPDRVRVPGSENSPVVGRVAFWTDDETSKVNVNTASEGAFWGTPVGDTAQERKFSSRPPAQSEYQRYPGHPAMTSLAPVLFATSATSTPDLSLAQSEAIYELAPRIVGGTGTNVFTGTLIPDKDRLYANIDEVIFNASRGSQPAALSISPTLLERSRFFLTASSRAPEVTLFNTPRIAIWPLDANTTTAYRSPFDRLIAHCATINGQPYYFTRSDPLSATVDFSGRNVPLYKYLQAETSRPVPGFGVSDFRAKYGDDRDQILTEIFDYIRCANLDNPLLSNAGGVGYRYYLRNYKTRGQVTPIRIGDTQGFGRFPTISEVGIHFICTADSGDVAATAEPGLYDSNTSNNLTLGSAPGSTLKVNERRIEAIIRFELFVPGMGWPSYFPYISMRVRGLDSLGIDKAGSSMSLGFPAVATDISPLTPNHGFSYLGGTISSQFLFASSFLPARGVMPADNAAPSDITNGYQYAFVSAPLTVSSVNGEMTFMGGTFTVELFASRESNPASETPVATYSFSFPQEAIPIPALVASGLRRAGSSDITPREHFWTFSRDGITAAAEDAGRGRLAGFSVNLSLSPHDGTPFRSEDVVRTLVPSGHSDYRLAAAMASSSSRPINIFARHPAAAPGVKLAHSFVEARFSNYAIGEKLDAKAFVPGLNFLPPGRFVINQPDVPTYNASSFDNGDWDNGVGWGVDGAYINKPDEGNSANRNNSGFGAYFESVSTYTDMSTGGSLYSPNRQMPSAGMFGSLPTGVKAEKPFQTLLFRPQPSHPGAVEPRDHLLTDLFWMPVVEPYAISEPFSTAGKINMNYAIEPFSYIRRATGMVAALRAEKVTAIPNAKANSYKHYDEAPSHQNDVFRLAIDANRTLAQFDDVFKAGQVFRSSSQICDIHLIPVGETVASVSNDNFWKIRFGLTGDNSRERPYANLLGRLTTKSNTYTVHMKVQALKKVPSTTAGEWDESRDKVTGEYRGSSTIERYITPSDGSIPDYAATLANDPASNYQSLGNFYRWRTLHTRQFAP